MLAIESACIISHNSNVISFHRDDMSKCKLISISVYECVASCLNEHMYACTQLLNHSHAGSLM